MDNPVAGGIVSFVNDAFLKVSGNRVIRGGCWYSGRPNLRVASRTFVPPTYVDAYVGFRFAVYVNP